MDVTRELIEALNVYCFDNIWNENQKEYRVNVKPTLLEPLSVTGGFTTNCGFVELPTDNEPYYLYSMQRENIHGLILSKMPVGEWVNSVDLCNKYDVLMHIYPQTGRILSKQQCYIYWKPDGSGVYLATSKRAMLNASSHNAIRNVYVTLYRDSDVKNDMTIHSFYVPVSDNTYRKRQDVWDVIFATAENHQPYHVFINGFETRIRNVGDIPLDAFVDVLVDENILFEFDINLDSVKENFGFISTLDETEKYIVHIPKEKNPDNIVFTPSTIEIYVRSNIDNRGVYLHQVTKRAITNITHNDFGVKATIIDACRDHLGTQNVTLRVVARFHGNNNRLILDKNYVTLLYHPHTDEQIIQHLLGKISSKLDFWKAEHLEASTYVAMMQDVPDRFDEKNIYGYVEGLGYYHTIALLCDRVKHSIISDAFTGGFEFPKPYLYDQQPCFPIVYLNGYKVNWENVIVNNDNEDYVNIGFNKDNVYWQVGDVMSVELFVSGRNEIKYITPDATNNTIDLPYADYRLLERMDMDTSVLSYNRTDKISWKLITNVLGMIVYTATDTGCTLKFGPTAYGRTFAIQNTLTTYAFSKKLDADMSAGRPLVVDLEQYPVDAADPPAIPIYDTNYVQVFLNNRELAPHIDYIILENKDAFGNLIIKQVVLQNLKYLRTDKNNIVEVLIASATVDNETYGFTVSDRADTERDDVTIFFESLSTFHVGGVLEIDPQYRGAYFALPEGKYPDGTPFHVRTSIPTPVKEFIDKYHDNDDTTRIKILNDYFYGKIDDRPDKIIQDITNYAIFSPHMVLLIKDTLDGTLGATIDPDISKLMDYIKKYEKFYNADIIHSASFNKHWMRAVPHYRHWETSGPVQYQFIHDLINLLIPKDIVSVEWIFNR